MESKEVSELDSEVEENILNPEDAESMIELGEERAGHEE